MDRRTLIGSLGAASVVTLLDRFSLSTIQETFESKSSTSVVYKVTNVSDVQTSVDIVVTLDGNDLIDDRQTVPENDTITIGKWEQHGEYVFGVATGSDNYETKAGFSELDLQRSRPIIIEPEILPDGEIKEPRFGLLD
ncbi:hypothetical protein [Natronoglomus mannanivorans]|uniref:Uncharacterized protein n=1 Tax=Natronoglomus mannanivorans TaxID=2979990 RepID=A0AAP3E4R3_9EURY|nr:hypothetical protein [Halobacteria archaeon AArc-xg1-1]